MTMTSVNICIELCVCLNVSLLCGKIAMTFDRAHKIWRLEKWKHSVRSAGSAGPQGSGGSNGLHEVKWFA